MKAVCWERTNVVRVEQVADPAILNARDAIVRITSTAICGSDLHLLDGFIPTMRSGDIRSKALSPARSSRLWHSKQYVSTTAHCSALEWDLDQRATPTPAAAAAPRSATGMTTLAEMAVLRGFDVRHQAALDFPVPAPVCRAFREVSWDF